MPLVWGASIAFAQLLAGLNQWPLLWMGYDTATSETSFAIQQVTTQIAAFMAFTGVFTLSFMALLAPGTSPDDLLSWAVLSLLSGALLLGAYLWVLRDRPALVVLAAAAMTVPGILDRGMDQAYGGALLGSLLGAAAVSYLAWRWFAHLTTAR